MAQGHAIQLVPVGGTSDAPRVQDAAQTAASEDIQSAAVAPPDQGTGNVDKIRDILFGTHMREYGGRFARLEENLLKESADIREDAKKRFDTLETYVRNQFEAFQERLKSEREDRLHSSRQAARELSELEGVLTKKISELDEQTSQADRHLRLELLQQSKEFSEDLRRKQDEIATLLDRRFQELRREKTDRAALATLFTEMAMRLNDEFQVPGVES